MKTNLYIPKVQKVEVTLTFLIGGLRSAKDDLDLELYDILEGIAEGHEGERTYNGRTYNIVLEDASATTKRRT